MQNITTPPGTDIHKLTVSVDFDGTAGSHRQSREFNLTEECHIDCRGLALELIKSIPTSLLPAGEDNGFAIEATIVVVSETGPTSRLSSSDYLFPGDDIPADTFTALIRGLIQRAQMCGLA